MGKDVERVGPKLTVGIYFGLIWVYLSHSFCIPKQKKHEEA